MELIKSLRRWVRWLTAWLFLLYVVCHPVFHVTRLKKAVLPQVQPQELLLGLTEDGVLQAEPEQLLDVRYTAAGAVEVLVKWQGLPDCDNSWELLSTLQSQFPHAHLEDNVVLPLFFYAFVFFVFVRRKRGMETQAQVLTNTIEE